MLNVFATPRARPCAPLSGARGGFGAETFLRLLGASVFFIAVLVFCVDAAAAAKPYTTDAGQMGYAKFLAGEKDYAGAAREFARLIEEFPASPLVPEAQFRLSDALYRAGRLRDAEEEFRLFLRNFGDSPFAPEAKERLKELKARKAVNGAKKPALSPLRKPQPTAAPPGPSRPEAAGAVRQVMTAAAPESGPVLTGSPLSGFNPADLAGVRRAVFFDGRGFIADNAGIPVVGLLENDWGTSISPQNANRALAYWNAGAGAVYDGWRVAAFYRGEFYIDANRDTVDFLSLINRKAQLPTGRVFNIDLAATGFSAKGVEVSKGIGLDWLVKGLSAGVTARYISGGMLQYGTLTGSATATSPTTYDFSYFLDYNYDKNVIYPRKAAPGSGNGYSFDIGFRYSAPKVFSAGLLFRDIAGRIYWSNVPFSTVDATSNVKSFDSSGYQQYRPTIEGYEGYRNFTQRIPLKVDADVSATIGPLTLSPEVNIMNGRPLYWLIAGYRASENTAFSAGFNTNYGAWTAGVAYKRSRLSVFSSGIDPATAPALGAALTLWWGW